MIPDEILHSLSLHFSGSGTPFRVLSVTGLSGGCINHVSRLETTSGTFCLKYNLAAAFPGMFEAEALGLNLLAGSGEIRIPAVITTGRSTKYSFILLEYIASFVRRKDFAEDFGRRLARLHRHTQDTFGLDHDNYMGSLAQQNAPHPDFITFFREDRLDPQIRLAAEGGYLAVTDISSFEKLFVRLPEILPVCTPSLIHGDLWSGNFMVDDTGSATLIDPAVSYGHREGEIAMTTLFGGFDAGFYHAYNTEWPMEPGWRERLAIYNLYPLLIHVNLFGSGYLGGIRETLRNF